MTQDLQNKAEKIKQELLALQKKGYGKTDVSNIPKGVDISTLPSISPQPLPESEPNNLLTFKETLSKVTNLAREKRNALSLEFMAPFQGIAPASDFSSILSNLNRASDTFAQDILKQTQPKYELRNVGDDLMEFEFDASGRVKSSRVVANKPKSSDIGDISIKDLNKKAREKFGDFSSKIINGLTEEQLREFIQDFDETEKKLNASVDVSQFFDTWKKEVGIKKEEISDFRKKLKDAIIGMKEIDIPREKAEKNLKKEYGKTLPKAVLEILDEVYQ